MNLQSYNTLGLPARADQVIFLDRSEDLPKISKQLSNAPRCIIGGGSNVVMHAPIRAAVLINRIPGKQIDAGGLLEAGAGESWHELVMWSLKHGFAGLENLALIPGNAGAAPVQNIGAYGAEIKNLLVDLTAWDFRKQDWVRLAASDCAFGYRDSIFKRADIQGPWDAPRYCITQIRLQLVPIAQAKVNIDYKELGEAVGNAKATSPMNVARAVMAIRSRKLPDPNMLGNVGSFFKNPVISTVQAKNLRLSHPDLPQYPAGNSTDDTCKISAAWLIERCGFKGARRGDVGVYENHALVLVNHGGGTGREILALAKEIQQAVVAKFGVFLEPEPVFMPEIGSIG